MMTPSVLWSPLGTLHRHRGEVAFPETWLAPLANADVDAARLTVAWELVRLGAPLPAVEARALMLVLVTMMASTAQGSTATREVDVVAMADLLDLGEMETAGARRMVHRMLACDPALAFLVGAPGNAVPVIAADATWLQFQRLDFTETAVADAVCSRLATSPLLDPHALQTAMDDLLERPPAPGGAPTVLNTQQREAVRQTALNMLTVVTGGPGTGKTSVVIAMLRLAARLGVAPNAMALAAPTGKAADRMQQSLSRALACIAQPADADGQLAAAMPVAQTLHRLLGWSVSAGRFRHHGNNPLAAALVVVDEASMVDTALMERLLSAVAPHARLVLLGDADQLPSVEAGAVLRDLCQHPGRQKVRLTHSWRMDAGHAGGRAILNAATQVLDGHWPALLGGDNLIRTHNVQALNWEGVTWIEENHPQQRLELLNTWFDRFASSEEHRARVAACRVPDTGLPDPELLAQVFAFIESARLLCALREAPGFAGVEAVNTWFRARLARAMGRRAVTSLLPGEPVMVTVNDYERGLFNGDTGVVLATAASASLHAVFRRGSGFVTWPLEAVAPRLEPAWATTVHKAQGSEADTVALLLPTADSRLLGRELLYTALTRARRGAVVLGPEAPFKACVERAGQRKTRLGSLLAAKPAGHDNA